MRIRDRVTRALIALDVARSRAQLERDLETARGALTELLCLVKAELDPGYTGPWSSYVTGDDRRALLAELEAEHAARHAPPRLEVIR